MNVMYLSLQVEDLGEGIQISCICRLYVIAMTRFQ